MHGHQFDPFNHNGLKWVGDTIAWIGGQLELIDPDIDKKFSNWRRKVSSWFAKGSQRLSGTGRYGNESKYIDLAIDYVKKMKDAVLYNKVILGHTHKPAVVKVNNMIYYNCGCWVEDDFRYIEIREGYTELKKFEKSNRFYSS
jgi:UDP-2,3-diacylglucosamine pyrophosphatase LpxH